MSRRLKNHESYEGRPLLVLLDIDDWACAQANLDDLSQASLLVFDLDLHLTLKAHKIEHATVWDVLEVDDKHEVHALADSAWEFWQQHASLIYRGLDLFRMATVRHQGWVNRFSFVTFVLRRVFELWEPECVIAFEEKIGHGLTPQRDYRKMPTLFMLLRGMADRRGIPVTLITEEMQHRRPSYCDHIAAAKEGREVKPLDLQALIGSDPYVLFFGNDYDLRRQSGLIQTISDHAQFQVAQLYRTADVALLESLKDQAHLLLHDEEVAPSQTVDLDATLKSDSRALFDSKASQANAELQDIFSNSACGPHYDFLFDPYLDALAGHVVRWQSLFERARPGLVVVQSPEPVVDIASEAGIPVLTLPHSLMLTGEPEYLNNAKNLTVGAIGKGHAKRLLESGLHPEQVRITGDPTVDEVRARVGQIGSQHRQSMRDQLGIRPDQRMVLLVTGCLAMQAQQVRLPRINWKSAALGFEQLGREISGYSDWQCVVKQHPRFDHPLLVDYANRELPRDRRMQRLTDQPLHELVAASDAVVVFNIVTSALIEASFQPRPVVVLSESLCWYDSEQWDMHHWAHFQSVPALVHYLQTIFSSSEAYTSAVAQTVMACENYLGTDSGAVLPRVTSTVQDLMRTETISS